MIESFLLNIPIPPIFVYQRLDGVWDVVDGLQRLSTILEFMGEYKEADGNLLPPLKLEGTKYLPSLDGMKYDDPDDVEHSFAMFEKRYLKMARINCVIVKKESDESGKFEIFQRLNTGGTDIQGWFELFPSDFTRFHYGLLWIHSGWRKEGVFPELKALYVG